MTEITKLLKGKAKQDFDNLMYGEDYESGLLNSLPIGLAFADEAVECIYCMVILKQTYDLSEQSKSRLYYLYEKILDHIAEKHPDVKICENVYTKKYFKKFINAYPQILK